MSFTVKRGVFLRCPGNKNVSSELNQTLGSYLNQCENQVFFSSMRPFKYKIQSFVITEKITYIDDDFNIVFWHQKG